MRRVLIVEDKDAKFDDLKQILGQIHNNIQIERAETVVEAENLLTKSNWNFLILDISMDINGTSNGALGGGHASLGGLDVIDTMFYESIEIPTVVVTGLDYFISANESEGSHYIGLEELEDIVSRRLRDCYAGCIRYGSEGWAARFKAACEVIKW